MKKQNIFLPPLFTVLTLGIYGLYWLYRVRKGLISRTSNPKDVPPVSVLFAPLLIGLLLLIVPADQGNSIKIVLNISIIILVLSWVVLPLWWFYKFYMTLEKVTRQTDGIILYVIGLVLTIAGVGVFAMLIAQNDINKYLAQNVDYQNRHPGETGTQIQHPPLHTQS